MIRRLAVFAATLLTAVSTTSAATPPVQKTVISTVSHGVKLTLMVPRRVYPENALVRVVVTLRNLSQQDVQVSGQGMFCCGQYSLGAVVRDTSGQILHATDRIGTPLGPGLSPLTVAPRHSMSERVFLVLRADRVQGVVQVQKGSDYFTVQTPVVTVRLVTERAPRVILHAPVADQLAATIRPPTHMKGYLYYLGSYRCGKSDLPAGLPSSAEPFQLSLHSRLTADFSYTGMPVTSWYVLAGWLNHPVVAIDYTHPSDRKDKVAPETRMKGAQAVLAAGQSGQDGRATGAVT